MLLRHRLGRLTGLLKANREVSCLHEVADAGGLYECVHIHGPNAMHCDNSSNDRQGNGPKAETNSDGLDWRCLKSLGNLGLD